MRRWSDSPDDFRFPDDQGASSLLRYPLTVFYDGACTLCSREMGFMKRLDRKDRLRFEDFSDPTMMSQRSEFLCQN